MVVRYDIGTLRKAVKTDAGFLRVDAYLTRSGVFSYRNPDGTIRKEFRPPSEVFRADSMRSFSGLPVTNDHPAELLTADTAKEHTRGSIGDSVAREGDWLRAPLTIVDSALIADMEAGKTAVSLGYHCDLEETPGEYQGERYDSVQRNIVGNHAAIVSVARAGEMARARMDCGEFLKPMVVVRIDNVDYEVSNETAKQAIQKALADLKARADAAEAVSAESKASLAAAQTLIAQLQDPKAIAAKVAERAALETEAKKHLKSPKLDSKTDLEIKCEVIKKLMPSAKFDAANVIEVNAFYKAALSVAESRNDASIDNARKAAIGSTEVVERDDESDGEDPEEAARKRMKDAYKDAWKGEKK